MDIANVHNGVNVDRLIEIREEFGRSPELAVFRFRARSDWQGGARSVAAVQGFYGSGQKDMSRPRPFDIPVDEPTVLVGGNSAPSAMELLLAALTASLSTGFVYAAALDGIRIETLEVSADGKVDVRALLGLTSASLSSLGPIHLGYRVTADISRSKQRELWRRACRASPVLHLVRDRIRVAVDGNINVSS